MKKQNSRGTQNSRLGKISLHMETPPSVIIYFCCDYLATEWVKQLYQDEFVKTNSTDWLKNKI